MKKVGQFVLILCVLVSGKAFAEPPMGSPFQDVATEFWAFEAIDLAVQKGYVEGFGDRTFRPMDKVTRAQYAKMLVSAIGYGLCDCPDRVFTDVQEGYWADPYIKTAIKEGLIYPAEYDYKFQPDDPISRKEMASMAVRALLGKKEGLMYQAVKLGVLKGYTAADGLLDLRPEGLTNRAEAVVVIERVLTVLGGGMLPVNLKMVEQAEVLEFGSNAETMMGVAMRDFVRNPLIFDMGTFDVQVLRVLVYDDSHPNTQYYPMFEHAVITEDSRGKVYRMAFEVKATNKTKERRAFSLETSWSMQSYSAVAQVDAEKYNYLPMRQTIEGGQSAVGFIILGVYKDALQEYGNMRLQVDAPGGTQYIYLQATR